MSLNKETETGKVSAREEAGGVGVSINAWIGIPAQQTWGISKPYLP